MRTLVSYRRNFQPRKSRENCYADRPSDDRQRDAFKARIWHRDTAVKPQLRTAFGKLKGVTRRASGSLQGVGIGPLRIHLADTATASDEVGAMQQPNRRCQLSRAARRCSLRSSAGWRVAASQVAKVALTVLGLLVIVNARSEEMAKVDPVLDKERLEFAKETIRLFGDKIPEEAQKGILKQQVLIGMTPYEAKLAGGAFYFKVQADPKNWKPNANPHVVMDRQSVSPDKSKIWMTFENETQFPGESKQRFTAYIFNGKVQSIEKGSK
jgi:hypothetical protein